MSETAEVKKRGRVASFLTRLAVILLCLVLLVAVAVRIYLATPYPASQVSRLVSQQLDQRFTVQSIGSSGTAVILKGIRLQNPPGFPEGDLVAADAVTVKPVWRDLLEGKQHFRLIALDGIRVALDKNEAGVWNFTPLQRHLAQKPAQKEAVETLVERLVVKNGTLQVQRQGVTGISLTVHNLATMGSLESQVVLAFQDPGGNRYRLQGKARPGADAALDLALTAPALSLKEVAKLLKLKDPRPFEDAQGALRVNATLEKGELATSGDFSFTRIRLPAPRPYSLQGSLHLGAEYSSASDLARLQKAVLTLDRLARLEASGEVRGVKGERAFRLRLAMDRVDLATLNALVPEATRKGLLLGGKLSCEALEVTGSRGQAVRSVVGTLRLQEGRVAKREELFVAGLGGSIGLTRHNGAIAATGKLEAAGGREKALIEKLDLPFALAVSPKLKLMRAETRGFAATAMAIPITGTAAFDAAKDIPLRASLKVQSAKVSALNSFMSRYDLSASSGTVSATVDASGKGPGDLSATARILLADLRGRRGKDGVALGRGSIATELKRRGGSLQAKGEAELAAAEYNGKGGDGRFRYRYSDGFVDLDDARFAVAGTAIRASHLRAGIPAKRIVGRATALPVSLDIEGGSVQQRDLALANLGGKVRGSLMSEGDGRWLEGNADLGSSVAWQGRALGTPALRASFTRAGARTAIGGTLLGGSLSGSAAFDPLSPAAGATFDAKVAGARLSAVAPLIPKQSGMRPAEGEADLRARGQYTRREGISCQFEVAGNGVTLVDKGGKSMVSGAGLKAAGTFAGDRLTLADAVLTAGDGVALKLNGTLDRPLAPDRSGSFTFQMARTPVNSLVDPFVNALPRMIQEATLDGSVAAGGSFELRGGRKLLQGAVTFQGGKIEVPSQKLAVDDIEGKLPFSVDFAGKEGSRPKSATSFSRENYPAVLEQLRNEPGRGELLSAGRVAFGVLELGKLSMRVSAANGITEISSLTTSLYEGAILGKGYLAMQEKIHYRADLVVNGLSMRALCRTLPIEGYISGKVDGVLSVNGLGGGTSGLTGFLDLWARPGKGEKMVVSKEFLQKLAKQKLSGFFFRTDRPYDEAEIKAMLQGGDLTFDVLKILNTNLFGVRDLNVSIAPGQNRIALDHLLQSIKEAAVRGKPSGTEPAQGAPSQEFKWGE